MGRWQEGEGWERDILEQEKPPKVATLSPCHTTRPGRHLANDGSSSRSLPAQLVPPIGAILLTVISQSWQNALQKSRPAHYCSREWITHLKSLATSGINNTSIYDYRYCIITHATRLYGVYRSRILSSVYIL